MKALSMPGPDHVIPFVQVGSNSLTQDIYIYKDIGIPSCRRRCPARCKQVLFHSKMDGSSLAHAIQVARGPSAIEVLGLFRRGTHAHTQPVVGSFFLGRRKEEEERQLHLFHMTFFAGREGRRRRRRHYHQQENTIMTIVFHRQALIAHHVAQACFFSYLEWRFED